MTTKHEHAVHHKAADHHRKAAHHFEAAANLDYLRLVASTTESMPLDGNHSVSGQPRRCDPTASSTSEVVRQRAL
ncbi:MAG: hypothetical protein EBV49_13270 [Betaproteobacteria bacterium]|nr:hypothetical protein [Betaproteobacteria bacterium]